MIETLPAPIEQSRRTPSVDVLRGFALLGVVIANLISFFTFVMPETVIKQATSGPVNHYYEWLFTVFIDNKFITLFSLLFGYGFGILIERAKSNGLDPVHFYTRRMLILLAAGLIHVFLWWGEILHTYAICGLLMLLFMNASNKNLLRWAMVFMLVLPLPVRYFMITTKAFDPAVSEGVYTRYLELSLRPDLLSVLKANWQLHQYVYWKCLAEWMDLLQALSKFLIGYWIMRRGLLNDIARNHSMIRRTLLIAAPVAVLYLL